jgi:hypothetical protein
MRFRAGGKSTTFKFDIVKLEDKAVKQEFSSVIASNMRNIIQLQAEDAEMEDTWEAVKDSVKTVACEVLVSYIIYKLKEWLDEESKNATQARNGAYHLYLARSTRGMKQELDRLNRQVHSICRRKKRKHMTEKILKIGEEFNSGNLYMVYSYKESPYESL